MLTFEELEALRERIPGDPDLRGLLATLRNRSERLLRELPPVPRVKAFLSRDGGVCPLDGAPLRFDPWSPDRHVCSRCGQSVSGERHHGHWARAQHLWLAERTAELALVSVLAEEPAAAERAAELLAGYEELYFELPNRDNVLGPSHLFFSTYLESLWLTSYLAAAFILREAGSLSEERIEGVNRVADEAARIIADFNEGLSNRQTWHAAALTAVAAWFGDADLARTAVEERTGVVGHLADGFGEDGLWWEGENYHLFALRGVMQGIHWARAAGYDLLDAEEIRLHFRASLLAPTRSALPDFTYPARRDSRFGVSLAEASSLELWEIGRGWLGRDAELDSWLGALYALESPPNHQLLYDAWLHDAGRTVREPHQRSELSWWALTALGPAPEPEAVAPWRPGSVLLESQALAVLRQGNLYASLECGRDIGGHGHPDRLHLTLHAEGVHWLPDPGTGSYVEPELFWYRSALAHNAPLLDGVNAGGEDAWCDAFDADGTFAWCRARAGTIRRTLIASAGHLVDILEVDGPEERRIELPWHLQGEIAVSTPDSWAADGFTHPFVSEVEALVASATPWSIEVRHPDSRDPLRAFVLAVPGQLLRATAPGLPNDRAPRRFLMVRARAGKIRWITVIDPAASGSATSVTGIEAGDASVRVHTGSGTFTYAVGDAGLDIAHPGGAGKLAGFRSPPPRHRPIFAPSDPTEAEAAAPLLRSPPALDGTLDGFDISAPLVLDSEHQYRRSEEPYDPEALQATAWINWDGDALYLAVQVTKPEIVLRPPDATPLGLDNEPEDINSDGLEIFLDLEGKVAGVLVVPLADGGVATRALGDDPAAAPEAEGAWAPTEDGYRVTLVLRHPALAGQGKGGRIGFDLLINEMQPGRIRRAGQLVWGGGGGWIYLAGDRHDPRKFGILELG